MHKHKTLTGFVIGRQQLGEADRILRLFTREEGRIDVMARGIRRAGAKLASRTEPFYEVEWRLVVGKQLPIVTGAEVIHAPDRLTSLEALSLGQALLELTERSFHTDESSEYWYNMLSEAFRQITTNPHGVIWTAALARSLDQLGLTPDLPSSETSVRVKLSDGRVVEHTSEGGEELTSRMLKLWKACRSLALKDVLRITDLDEESRVLSSFLERFWQYHTGIELKATKLT
jgi:DNA repair protein RecO (recombination protein O)